MIRVIVDAAGRFVSVAYTGRTPGPGQRIVEVTHAELDRLLADDVAWLNNRDQLRDLARALNALQGNQEFLANGSPTQQEAIVQLRRITRQVNAVIRLFLSTFHPHLLDEIADT